MTPFFLLYWSVSLLTSGALPFGWVIHLKWTFLETFPSSFRDSCLRWLLKGRWKWDAAETLSGFEVHRNVRGPTQARSALAESGLYGCCSWVHEHPFLHQTLGVWFGITDESLTGLLQLCVHVHARKTMQPFDCLLLSCQVLYNIIYLGVTVSAMRSAYTKSMDTHTHTHLHFLWK